MSPQYVIKFRVDLVQQLHNLYCSSCIRVTRAELTEANNAAEHYRDVFVFPGRHGAIVAQFIGNGGR